jgi:hypothetical protein
MFSPMAQSCSEAALFLALVQLSVWPHCIVKLEEERETEERSWERWSCLPP